MKPNQPDNEQSSLTEDTADTPTNIAYSKDMVDKVVDRLNKLDEFDDPNQTWTPPRPDNTTPELDLTLTEDDEDYSTQPIPSNILLHSEFTKGTLPATVESPTQEFAISAQFVDETEANPLAKAVNNPPWTLQQFFNGEIDLDVELSKRFPTMPMMSILKTRALGTNTGRKVAQLSSQDGAATMTIDADTVSKVIQLSFSYGSMLTLKFAMNSLNNMDRERWVELMRRDEGGLAFLWGTKRWTSDYIICISRKHFTNLYAFSPNNFEAGVRMTPTLTRDLLDWLEQVWDEPEVDDEPPQLLTW